MIEAKPIAWISGLPRYDLLTPGGLLGAGDDGAHAGERFPFQPTPARDLIGQCDDLATNYWCRHHIEPDCLLKQLGTLTPDRRAMLTP